MKNIEVKDISNTADGRVSLVMLVGILNKLSEENSMLNRKIDQLEKKVDWVSLYGSDSRNP